MPFELNLKELKLFASQLHILTGLHHQISEAFLGQVILFKAYVKMGMRSYSLMSHLSSEALRWLQVKFSGMQLLCWVKTTTSLVTTKVWLSTYCLAKSVNEPRSDPREK